MAVDYFLEIDGIEGESAAAKHKGDIDLIGFSFGASMGKQSGVVPGIAFLDELYVLAPTSKASPLLWLACASGRHFPTAVLTCCRKTQKGHVDFFRVTLADVTITSYETSADDGEPPVDQLSLRYFRIEVAYQPADASKAPATASWHVNKIPDLKA
ncbi:MAG TPA: type VI secretion system tube protein Hcp [Gaiellaceae bacterium]|jgi:type VI secretion system secreted protein Hcp